MFPVIPGYWLSVGIYPDLWWVWVTWWKAPPSDLLSKLRGCLEFSSGLQKVCSQQNLAESSYNMLILLYLYIIFCRCILFLCSGNWCTHELLFNKEVVYKILCINCSLFLFRWALWQLLPTIPPAPACAAGETPLPGSASAKPSRPHSYAAGALLCCIPALCKISLDPYLWWVQGRGFFLFSPRKSSIYWTIKISICSSNRLIIYPFQVPEFSWPDPNPQAASSACRGPDQSC